MGVQGQVKGAGEHFSHLTAVVLTAHSPEELVSSGLPRFMGKPEVFAASRGLYVKTALCCHLPVGHRESVGKIILIIIPSRIENQDSVHTC